MNTSLKNAVVFFSTILIIGAIAAIVFYYTGKNSKKYILAQPQKYCYDTSRHIVNPAFVIQTLKFKDDLIKYYNTISRNPKSTPVIPFSITTLPQQIPVYIMGYTDDSLLVDVVCYYDRGPSFANKRIRGWVYFKTLHNKPPDTNKIPEDIDLLDVIRIYENQQRKKDSLGKR